MRIYDLRESNPRPAIRGEIYKIDDIPHSNGSYELSFLLDSGYDVRITQKEIEFALEQRKGKTADGKDTR